MAYVLVVDDEPDSSEFVATFLQRSGYKAKCVPNGREALKALIDSYPDAVVLDVRMPGMDGISLLEILRSYLRWESLPVVVLTAHATPAQIQRAGELGVRHVFHKANFTLPDLAAALEELTTAGNRHTPN
jgi:CheY-like chemotaxis protein